jgi:riboflavin synthase alpha subunit
MFYIIPHTLLKVSLSTNKTGKQVTMFYVIPDTLLKVALSTNKTGHHVLRYT